MTDRPPTPPATLSQARDIGLTNGLRYVYTGNVHDRKGQTTSCHECGSVLVERDRYRLGRWGVDARGRCASCGARCAGVFDPGGPGTWGSRRQPVRISRRRRP